MSETSQTPDDELDAAERRVGETMGGKWRLDRLLGIGGMASVYAATHKTTSRPWR